MVFFWSSGFLLIQPFGHFSVIWFSIILVLRIRSNGPARFSDHNLQSTPFSNQTLLDHSNTRLVQYSDGYCNLFFYSWPFTSCWTSATSTRLRCWPEFCPWDARTSSSTWPTSTGSTSSTQEKSEALAATLSCCFLVLAKSTTLYSVFCFVIFRLSSRTRQTHFKRSSRKGSRSERRNKIAEIHSK